MTVDYSKIDFTKCKLEPLGDLPIDVTSTKISVSICSTETGVALLRKEYDSVWKTAEGSLYMALGQLSKLFCSGSAVDVFIAAETAWIEKEAEAANWVPVPWQDVEFLVNAGATVKHGCYLVIKPIVGDSKEAYVADRRTFPAGYDPTQPRWVRIHKDDARRLSDAGARVQRKMSWSDDTWRDMTSTERGSPHDYQLDTHTLPPGVPLHVEPKPEDSTDQYHASKLSEPKPEPRPCSKEFALSHLDESQARVRSGSQWGNWVSAGVFDYVHDISSYEFRTTAKEETALDLGPFPDVTIDVNEEVSQAIAIHLLKSRRVAIVDLETGQRFMVTPGPLVKDGA